MRTRPRAFPGFRHNAGPASEGFTLIEIMVVVAIIGVIMAAGIPTLYHVLHKEGFRKSVSDILDVCQAARARAVLRGEKTEVDFHPQNGTCDLVGGEAGGGLAHSASLVDGARIEMLDVNLHEYKDADIAKVRFFPNGTCDEMTLILRSPKNDQCGITLEITTGLATYLNENDLQALRDGRL